MRVVLFVISLSLLSACLSTTETNGTDEPDDVQGYAERTTRIGTWNIIKGGFNDGSTVCAAYAYTNGSNPSEAPRPSFSYWNVVGGPRPAVYVRYDSKFEPVAGERVSVAIADQKFTFFHTDSADTSEFHPDPKSYARVYASLEALDGASASLISVVDARGGEHKFEVRMTSQMVEFVREKCLY